MRPSSIIGFAGFGLSTVLLGRQKPIIGTVIVTDRCNLSCKHCTVNNLTAVMHPYAQLMGEMRQLYQAGVRVLFFCGGETFLWADGDKTLRSLVVEAKAMGFWVVNVVTNGTFPLDLPEADLILLSLDGDRERHDDIRGETYDLIMRNIDAATADNICLYMAINQLNKGVIQPVCDVARSKPKVRAVSFNFHTPYPGTEELALSVAEKQACCDEIAALMGQGYPVFNLRSAFPHIARNSFPTPCHHCVVLEDGRLWTCGRCADVPGLCERCGYFFAAEYNLAASGDLKVIVDMVRTYLRYV